MPPRSKRPWSPHYWSLAWELTRTEFKLRDQGTLLGFLWTLLHPALMFLVLYALFIKWVGRHVEDYSSYLLIGLVQWQFFEKSTSAGLSSLRRKSSLIRNFDFAREIVVLSAVGSVFLSYALELCVMLVFLWGFGAGVSASWLAVPLLAALSLALSVGASLVLSLVSAEFEDLERIWALLLTAGFYLTPVFYPLHLISEEYHSLMALNPMLHVIGAWRACLLPSGRFDAVGTGATALAAGAVIAVSLLAFRRWERWVSDRVIRP